MLGWGGGGVPIPSLSLLLSPLLSWAPRFAVSQFSTLRAWPGREFSALLAESLCLSSLCSVGPEEALLRPGGLWGQR